MKAITLYQPWATLVAIGAKKIETRSWNSDYRGPLAIHAGKNTKFIKGKEFLLDEEPFYSVLMNAGQVWHSGTLPLGCIVATCTLVQVRQMNELLVFPACKSYAHQGKEWLLNEQERAFGFYAVGRYMWLLDDVHILPEPIPATGSMGFWEWSL
jgi:activating signal cointegrator 1